MPAIARPTISMYDELAAPHIAEPSSKIVKKVRNVHCIAKLHVCNGQESNEQTLLLKYVYIFPLRGWTEQLFRLERFHI